jgi:hypothetical protein
MRNRHSFGPVLIRPRTVKLNLIFEAVINISDNFRARGIKSISCTAVAWNFQSIVVRTFNNCEIQALCIALRGFSQLCERSAIEHHRTFPDANRDPLASPNCVAQTEDTMAKIFFLAETFPSLDYPTSVELDEIPDLGRKS